MAALTYPGPVSYKQKQQCSWESWQRWAKRVPKDGYDRQSMSAFLCGGGTLSCVLSGPPGWCWAKWHARPTLPTVPLLSRMSSCFSCREGALVKGSTDPERQEPSDGW